MNKKILVCNIKNIERAKKVRLGCIIIALNNTPIDMMYYTDYLADWIIDAINEETERYGKADNAES